MKFAEFSGSEAAAAVRIAEFLAARAQSVIRIAFETGFIADALPNIEKD
jgi:hypothetical protein